MLKHGSWLGCLALAVVAGACATAPETAAPDRPAETPAERPAEPGREAPLRIGVVVSTTGSATLRQVADLVLDGARVGATAAGTARRDVELVVRDDGGTPAGAARAVRELEAAGVRAVVGPLTDAGLAAAVAARTSPDLLLIGPMAVSDPAAARNVLALNVVDTRGSAALGEYARRYSRVGILYPRTVDGTRQARAFAQAYAGGSRVLTETPYDSSATNLASQLSRLRTANVQALFVPGTERELQIALPQVEYFGLTDVQMLGTEAWVSDGSRGLPARVVQGTVIATPLLRESSELAWSDFVAGYEAAYRRSLANPLPALGYDAVLLAVRALSDGSTSADLRGATGVLSQRDDAVTRKPFLVRIDAGRLIPVH